jgi:hypothetical protein
MTKVPLKNEQTLKTEGQNIKLVMLRGRYSKKGRVNEEAKRG